MPRVGMSIEAQKEAVKMGALLEYVIGEALGTQKEFAHWVEGIRAVGPRTSCSAATSASGAGRSLPTGTS